MILVVYAANLLAHEVVASEEGVPSRPFDMDYLCEAGAIDLLPQWRKLATAALSSASVLVH